MSRQLTVEEHRNMADNVKAIMATQLTELEVIIYLLMEEEGVPATGVADRLPLGISHDTIQRYCQTAKAKMEKMADAGLFQTAVEKAQERRQTQVE